MIFFEAFISICVSDFPFYAPYIYKKIYYCDWITYLVLGFQVHTPDSSRYWIAHSYEERFHSSLEPENVDKVRYFFCNVFQLPLQHGYVDEPEKADKVYGSWNFFSQLLMFSILISNNLQEKIVCFHRTKTIWWCPHKLKSLFNGYSIRILELIKLTIYKKKS